MSQQAKRAASKVEWQERVKSASLAVLPEGHWATESGVAATLFYFPAEAMQGDLDNIVKPVLDALSRHVYIDDSQIERIVVQKFEPENLFPFATPSATLEQAMTHPKPVLYIRLSDDPFEELS